MYLGKNGKQNGKGDEINLHFLEFLLLQAEGIIYCTWAPPMTVTPCKTCQLQQTPKHMLLRGLQILYNAHLSVVKHLYTNARNYNYSAIKLQARLAHGNARFAFKLHRAKRARFEHTVTLWELMRTNFCNKKGNDSYCRTVRRAMKLYKRRILLLLCRVDLRR